MPAVLVLRLQQADMENIVNPPWLRQLISHIIDLLHYLDGTHPLHQQLPSAAQSTGHWARECPLNKGDKVGLLQSVSVLNEQANVCCNPGTVNAVPGASVLTGASAVPIPSAKAQQIAERVEAQRKDIRVSFGNNAVACLIH